MTSVAQIKPRPDLEAARALRGASLQLASVGMQIMALVLADPHRGRPAGKDGKARKHGKDEKAHAPKPWRAFSLMGRQVCVWRLGLQMGSSSRHLAR